MTEAESDVVEMGFPRYGFGIDRWVSYAANSNFLTPVDGFEFVVSDDAIDDTIRLALKSGEEFIIKVNGVIQAQGYIDKVTTESSRGGGTVVRIEGCDKLAQPVRAGLDPRTRFPNNVTLLDVLLKVFGPFGYEKIADFVSSNDVNRDVKMGQIRGDTVSRKGKPLKGYVLHQTKPYPGEGCYAFAARLSQRHGLWIWLSALDGQLIVSRPDFKQKPQLYLFDHRDGASRLTNILHGVAREDMSQQPSCIVATGYSYGGEADRSHLKVIAVNEIVSLRSDGKLTDGVKKVITDNPDALVLPIRGADVFVDAALRPHPNAQPIYLHDQESQKPEQLEGFARRELAKHQKDSLHVTYTAQGHSQEGVVWCVDSMVDVDDDARGIHENMWILGRTFEKSREGTFTRLELIRPFTLSFGSPEDE